MVTKNAWKTPPGARPNRDGKAFKLGKKQFLVSRLGWSLEAKREFSPREMTDLKDRTRLTGCLAKSKNCLHTVNSKNTKCSRFDSEMIQNCTKKTI